MFGLRCGLLGLIERRGSATVPAWSPATAWFAASEQGLWYDPSDLSTMFQDSAGTTPVTAVEQPVGLILDRRLGALGAIGANVATNGDFASNVTGWSTNAATLSWVSGAAQVGTAAGSGGAWQDVAVTAGKSYRIEGSWSGGNATIRVYNGGGFSPQLSQTTEASSATNFRCVATATSSTIRVYLRNSDTGTITFDGISVREIPGNHATQATSTARPTLRNRYNLLTYSEQFHNAIWTKVTDTVTANTATAPDGTLTADTYTHTSGRIQISAACANRTVRLYVKPVSGSSTFVIDTAGAVAADAVSFNLSTVAVSSLGANNTAATITSVGDGWLLLTVTRGATAGTVLYFGLGAAASVTYIWGAQMVDAGDASLPYQRIAAATDYDSDASKFPLYLAFDGSDDSLATGSVDFSGTDKMTVVAGLTNLTAASLGMLFELTATANTNAGAFNAYVNDAGTGGVVARSNKNGAGNTGPSEVAVGAPNKQVYGFDYDLTRTAAGQAIYIRRNGIAYSNGGTNPAGSEKFANAAIFIGRRGGSSLPGNFRLHQVVIRGAASADIAQAESFAATRTGVVL